MPSLPTLTNGQTNGAAQAQHDDAASSSSDEEVKKCTDEEVKKRIVVEISPLVTYSGEVSYTYTCRLYCEGTSGLKKA